MQDSKDGNKMIESNPRGFVFSITISAVCHLLFFFGVIYAFGFKGDVKSFSHNSVIDISLVSLPEKVEIDSPLVKEIKQKKDILSKAIPVVEKKSLKKKTYKKKKIKIVRIKKSLKKKTYEVARIRRSAIKNIEKKVKKTKIDPIQKALVRLKKEVAVTETEKSVEEKQEDRKDDFEQENDPFGQTSSATENAGRASTLLEIHRNKIGLQIQRNWAFAKQLAGGQTNLKANLALKVMADGKIAEIWFETRSGNAYFDEAVRKAVTKSNPVTPFPEGLNRPFDIFIIGFNPQGIW